MNMNESGRSEMHSDRAADDDAQVPLSGTGSAQDLKPFADQLMTIAQQLRDGEFSNAAADDSAASPKRPEQSDPRREHAARARQLYSTRRRRDAIFQNSELFGEPAWDILLDLYIAFADGKPVSVSSACIGSAAPPTTGLRWLGVLADEGLVVREQDPADQRRVLVRLTDRGVEYMDQYFASAGETC